MAAPAVLGSRVRHRPPTLASISNRFRRHSPVSARVGASWHGLLSGWVMRLGEGMSAPAATLVPVIGEDRHEMGIDPVAFP